ncbi:hypothetical protein BGX27_003694, partial [Mortierella sp. AM989]
LRKQTIDATPIEQPATNPLLNNSAHSGQATTDCGNDASSDTEDAKAAKAMRKAMEDHSLRYHSTVPVRYYCPTNSRYVKVLRDPAKKMAFQCVCMKTFYPRSSVARHFTTCKTALSAVASLAEIGPIPSYITLFKPAKGIHPKSTELREEDADECTKPEPEIYSDNDENRSVSDGDKNSEYDDDDATGDIDDERNKQKLELWEQRQPPLQQGNGLDKLIADLIKSQHEM